MCLQDSILMKFDVFKGISSTTSIILFNAELDSCFKELNFKWMLLVNIISQSRSFYWFIFLKYIQRK